MNIKQESYILQVELDLKYAYTKYDNWISYNFKNKSLEWGSRYPGQNMNTQALMVCK